MSEYDYRYRVGYDYRQRGDYFYRGNPPEAGGGAPVGDYDYRDSALELAAIPAYDASDYPTAYIGQTPAAISGTSNNSHVIEGSETLITFSKKLWLGPQRIIPLSYAVNVALGDGGYVDGAWLHVFRVPAGSVPGDTDVVTTFLGTYTLYGPGGTQITTEGPQTWTITGASTLTLPASVDLHVAITLHGEKCGLFLNPTGDTGTPEGYTQIWEATDTVPPTTLGAATYLGSHFGVYGGLTFTAVDNHLNKSVIINPGAATYPIPRYTDTDEPYYLMFTTVVPKAAGGDTTMTLTCKSKSATGTYTSGVAIGLMWSSGTNGARFPATTGAPQLIFGGDEASSDTFDVLVSIVPKSSGTMLGEMWVRNHTHTQTDAAADVKWRRVTPTTAYSSTATQLAYNKTIDYITVPATMSVTYIEVGRQLLQEIGDCSLRGWSTHYLRDSFSRLTLLVDNAVGGNQLTTENSSIRPTYLRFADLADARGMIHCIVAGGQDISQRLTGLTVGSTTQIDTVVADFYNRLEALVATHMTTIATTGSPLVLVLPSWRPITGVGYSTEWNGAQAFVCEQMRAAVRQLARKYHCVAVDLYDYIEDHRYYVDADTGSDLSFPHEDWETAIDGATPTCDHVIAAYEAGLCPL